MIVFLVLVAVVVATVLVARSGFGWLVAMLVPVIALTAYMVFNTLLVLLAKE